MPIYLRHLTSLIFRQASGFLRPECAPSSEHPRFGMPSTFDRCASCCCSSASAGIAIGANFKIYLLRQFCFNRVQFFLQYTGDTDAKNDGPEFWNSNSVIFENILKFSKRCLQPIWTIMVAAKLDHSRVLVTKLRQNRSTSKGRSAGQRHTHTDIQTDSAENKSPSGLQSGQ